MRRTLGTFSAVGLAALLAAAPGRAVINPKNAGSASPGPSAAPTPSPAPAPSPAPTPSPAPMVSPAATAPPAAGDGLESWLAAERALALRTMRLNISPAGAAAGAVAASPSRANPNYWYNWRRDAALTLDEVATLYAAAVDPDQRKAYEKALTDYAAFVRKEQAAKSLTGLGEPKFNMDGSPFNDAWGRPQDDSPAEEASALIGFASLLLKQGRKDEAARLYGDSATGIKGDLEYVSRRWPETSFDVWEEVKARHFDTEMAQRTALLEGSWLADQLGDPDAAKRYRLAAGKLEPEISAHWDPKRGVIATALGRDGGLDYKSSGLDAAVILAAIHRRPLDAAIESPAQLAFFSSTDKRVLATAAALKARFRAEYPINASGPGVAIGRYPEDRYYGGNPWVLLTAAAAQLDYAAAAEYLRRGEIAVEAESLPFFSDLLSDPADKAALKLGATLKPGDALFAKLIDGLARDGDAQLSRVRRHAPADGSLAEQMDKATGLPLSAADLTWNYASLLTAVQARDALSAAHQTAPQR